MFLSFRAAIARHRLTTSCFSKSFKLIYFQFTSLCSMPCFHHEPWTLSWRNLGSLKSGCHSLLTHRVGKFQALEYTFLQNPSQVKKHKPFCWPFVVDFQKNATKCHQNLYQKIILVITTLHKKKPLGSIMGCPTFNIWQRWWILSRRWWRFGRPFLAQPGLVSPHRLRFQ